MKKNGVNQATNQAMNRELVLCTLQNLGNCTRATLAKKTGLQQATITNIVSDLIACRIVEETGACVGEKGRRSIGIQLSGAVYRVIGFRLTRRYFSIGIFDLACKETETSYYEKIADSNPEKILTQACQIINEMIQSHPQYVFLAVGVAVPGPYYRDTGEIAMIASFPGWRNIQIQKIMQSRIPIPVVIDHDANGAVLAESCLVAGRDMYETMVYIAVGQGIGAGILEKGEVYHGTQGIAGEIGHTSVDIHGAPCECGQRGCLTLYASTVALVSDVRERTGNPDMTQEMAFDEIRKGNPAAVGAFKTMMSYLDVCIANMMFTYNPNCIVIGDEITQLGNLVLDELQSFLGRLNVSKLTQGLRIELASLGWDSAFTGAAMLAVRKAFSCFEYFPETV